MSYIEYGIKRPYEVVVTEKGYVFCKHCGSELCMREIRKKICYDCTLMFMGINPAKIDQSPQKEVSDK